MKNLFLTLTFLALSLGLFSQQIHIPTDRLKVPASSDSLWTYVENQVTLTAFELISRAGDFTIYQVAEGVWNPTKADYNFLVDKGCDIKEVTLVLKFPKSALDNTMNTSLGDTAIIANTTSGYRTREWAEYFSGTASKINTPETHAYCETINWTGRKLNSDEIYFLANLSGAVILMGKSDERYINNE